MPTLSSIHLSVLRTLVATSLLLSDAACVKSGGRTGGAGACTTTAECNDGDLCTTDSCSDDGHCDNAPISCAAFDDTCHSGACDPRDGTCVAEALVGAACDDLDPCSIDDHCDVNGQCLGTWDCPCDADADCGAAAAQCQRMACVAHVCVAQADPALDGSACDDGAFCTVADACRSGVCEPGAARTCPGGADDPCATASCDERADACVVSPAMGARCDDEDPCTHDDACDAAGFCSGVALVCSGSDDDPCRSAVCVAGVCVPQSEVDAACDDGDDCTSGDVCLASGLCAGSWDSERCSCAADADCVALDDACNEGRCDGETQACERVAKTGEACDDGDACSSGDRCSDQGGCVGLAYACDDGLSCTRDSCDGLGGCNHAQVVDSCLIGAVCYALGAANPANPCQRCAGGESWSPAASAPCDDGDPCTRDDLCDGGNCAGTVVACAPLPACQTATCDGAGGCAIETVAGYCAIEGACIAAGARKPGDPCRACVPALSTAAWSGAADGACDDGDPCTKADVCSAGVCRGTAYGCDDGAACTADVCDGAGGCAHQIVAGSCFIDGACWSNLALNPAGACRRCDTTASKSAWSPTPAASPCDDGLSCTNSDACDGSGKCVGSLAGCVFDSACETAACTATGCEITLKAGYCKIAGACFVDGAANPANACQRCASATSTSAWSAHTGGCDDGNACTRSDTCSAGACAGTSSPCDDGLACTVDACDGAGGCTTTLALDTCRIGGVCYAKDEPNPADPCRVCNPAASTSAWSVAQAGTPCTSDGLGCTLDVCSGTACLHPQVSGCLIDGACYDAGQANPGNSCEVCTSGTTWSARPANTPCASDGQSCTTDRCDANRTCQHDVLLDETVCDDGNSSSVGDWCMSGVCKGFVRAFTGPVGGAYQVAGTATGSGVYAAYVDPSMSALRADHFLGSLSAAPTTRTVDFAGSDLRATFNTMSYSGFVAEWNHDLGQWLGGAVSPGTSHELRFEFARLNSMTITAPFFYFQSPTSFLTAAGRTADRALVRHCYEPAGALPDWFCSDLQFAEASAQYTYPSLAIPTPQVLPRFVGRYFQYLAIFEAGGGNIYEPSDLIDVPQSERAAIDVEGRAVIVGEGGLFIVEKSGSAGFTAIAVPGWWAQSSVDFIGIQRFGGRIHVLGVQTEGTLRTLHLVVMTESADPGASASWRSHNLGATQASQVGGTLDNAVVNAMMAGSDGIYLFGRWWNAAAARAEKAVWRFAP